MEIVHEAPPHFDAIGTLLTDAFGGPDEAQLVSDLRSSGDVAAALIARNESGIAGHILFSKLAAVIGERAVDAVALAPLAVRKDCRKQGLGSRLVEHGLEQCRMLGFGLVAVVGDPAYYGRFGFSADRAASLRSAFAGPYLQILELRQGALGRGQGRLIYAAPFNRFS